MDVQHAPSTKVYQYEKLISKEYSRFICVQRKASPQNALETIGAWQFMIVTYKRAEAPPYEAVLYVWGTPDRTKPIFVNDNLVLLTTSSLLTVLPYLAAGCETGYLWIDQV